MRAAEEQVRVSASTLAETRQWASVCNLAAAYQDMTSTLTERAKNGSSTCRMMSGILPRWFVAYPFDPPFQIWTTRKGTWSEELGRVLEYQAPTLSPDHRYPLERRCEAIQIFNQSPRMWRPTRYSDADFAAFSEALGRSPVEGSRYWVMPWWVSSRSSSQRMPVSLRTSIAAKAQNAASSS